jgi:hypothetical protein
MTAAEHDQHLSLHTIMYTFYRMRRLVIPVQCSLPLASLPGLYCCIFLKVIPKFSLDGSLITQPLKRFMLRDYRQDIGRAKTEGGNVAVYFVGFSIEMAVQNVNCFYLSNGE